MIEKDKLLDLYLKEVSKLKVLTPEESNAIFREIAKIDKKINYYKNKYKFKNEADIKSKRIPEKIKEELENLIIEKNKLKEDLIKGNLRLVVKIVFSFCSKSNLKVDLIDLINEGNIGLIKGIEKFDYKAGKKLSTYVRFWIEEYIRQGINNQAYIIKIPAYILRIIKRYKNISENLMENLEVFGARKFSNLELDIDNIIEVLQYIKEPISLESSIDGKYELKEYIEDLNSMTPFEIVYYITLMEKLNDLIKKLKLNEQIVIKMKFGIDSGKEYTFKDIARHLGISCERVRQILNSALAHLKSEMIKNELI